ncbi:hypothetical protein RB595_008259 [Gaeumannomyces hyphopodioides]
MSSNDFHLIYWPGFPGRGEFVRIALEEAGIAYKDTAHQVDGMSVMQAQLAGDDKNPPVFAVPALRHGDVLISQTPNILQYLGEVAGLAPTAAAGGAGRHHVHALALTALDGFGDEVHGTHHPVDVAAYYDDQRAEALRYARVYVGGRLPKFLAYFEGVLAAPTSGAGPWLYGGRLTYADLALYHGLDGVHFAFPKAVAKAKESGKYGRVFALYDAVKERPNIKAYLASERRQKYSDGLFRYYPELDIV